MALASTSGIALVTGAASGIGQETAFGFARNGAVGVIFADFDISGARTSAKQSHQYATNSEYRAIAIEVDIRDEASVQAMVDNTVKEFGRIDYSVNSAGIANPSPNPVLELSLDAWDTCMQTMGRGTLLCVREVSKVMSQQSPAQLPLHSGKSRPVGRGSIVNVSSLHTRTGLPGFMPYVCAKAVMNAVTKTAFYGADYKLTPKLTYHPVSATELAPYSIRVNAVLPAWVDTPMTEKELTPEVRGAISTLSPPNRPAEPEEIADVIVFLCSPGASYISGEEIAIDNGWQNTINFWRNADIK